MLKTQYKLGEFGTSKPAVMEILRYVALLSLLVSRNLLDLVTEQADDVIVFLEWSAKELSPERASPSVDEE